MRQGQLTLFTIASRIALQCHRKTPGRLRGPPWSPESAFLAVCLPAPPRTSTDDTNLDGLSIETAPQAERGIAQGYPVAGRALNAILVDAATGWLSQNNRRSALLVGMGGLLQLAIPPAVVVHRPGARPQEGLFSIAAVRSLVDGAFLLQGLIQPLTLCSSNGRSEVFLHELLGVRLGRVGLGTCAFGVGIVSAQ
jgi:hypothetical protein